MTVLTAILIALVTGLLGALISTAIYIRRDRRMFKVQTLKKFAANRYYISGDKFSEAVNEIFVVFNDSEEVLGALESFHELVVNGIGGQERKDALVKLFKAMCNDTKIKYKDLNNSLFLIPFNARQGD